MDAIAPFPVGRMDDDGLQDAALADVFGQLGQLILGQLRAWIAGILVECRRGDQERLAGGLFG